MKNIIENFVDTIPEKEVQKLMYKISKRVIIPQYYTKEHIRTKFEENFGDTDLMKRINRETKLNNLLKTKDEVVFENIFQDLRQFLECSQEIEETLYNQIYNFVYEKN